MSGWNYKSELVKAGANTQTVRQLTVSERKEFARSAERIKTGEISARDLPGIVAGFGCINPPRTEDEIDSMPPDLFDACVAKILELTGMQINVEPDEKKAQSSPPSS